MKRSFFYLLWREKEGGGKPGRELGKKKEGGKCGDLVYFSLQRCARGEEKKKREGVGLETRAGSWGRGG